MIHPVGTLSTLAACLVGFTCGTPAKEARGDASITCQVERISDGDSFYCGGGKRVRLIGVDTPELNQGSLGRQSRDELRRLIPEGMVIRLELDVQPSDRYGRTLAYAWRDDLMVNREMVRHGWALRYTVPPNVRYVEVLRAAEDSARSDRTGHWRTDGFACPPERHRRRDC